MATYKHFLITISLFIIACTSLCAHKNIETQQLLWTRYNLKININDSYALRQELEERTYWFPWRQHQFVSRTLLERKIGKGWSTGFGMATFIQSLPQNPEIPTTENRVELRPRLEVSYWQELSKKFGLHHRYWSEFRFYEQPNGTLDYGNNRTRYKLELRYAAHPKVTLKVFDEILLNFGGQIVYNVFDQNRYGTSIQYMPINNFGFEIGYFNWFQQQKSGVDFYNRHIIRLTIHQNINIKSSTKQ
ncbi:MAG: DUF2490 domain-containing protein [Arenibacter sp.]